MTDTKKRPEFRYLDGLRGAAAMLVVVHHAFLFTGRSGEAESAMPVWGHLISFGYVGVAIFIVLSGYVLMLPVVSTADLSFRHGVWGFVKRRAKRILPPYYAALGFSLLLIALFPVMQTPSGTAWDSKLPVSLPAVITHFFLIHDLSSEWILKINGPLWSVAVEWQIYFVMALALVPLWRRLPPSVIVAALFAVSLVPAFIGVGTSIHPWFIALFAAGMWAAQLTMSDQGPRGIGVLALVLTAATPAVGAYAEWMGLPTAALIETVAGLALAAALVWVGRRELAGKRTPLAAPFRSRPLMWLGLISYSIYLFHSPLLGLFNLLTLPLGLPITAQYLLLTFAGIPIAVSVSLAMFWLVERHFLNTRQRHAKSELQKTDTVRIDSHEEHPEAAAGASSRPISPSGRETLLPAPRTPGDTRSG